jgi:hypothetical protein
VTTTAHHITHKELALPPNPIADLVAEIGDGDLTNNEASRIQVEVNQLASRRRRTYEHPKYRFHKNITGRIEDQLLDDV